MLNGTFTSLPQQTTTAAAPGLNLSYLKMRIPQFGQNTTQCFETGTCSSSSSSTSGSSASCEASGTYTRAAYPDWGVEFRRHRHLEASIFAALHDHHLRRAIYQFNHIRCCSSSRQATAQARRKGFHSKIVECHLFQPTPGPQQRYTAARQ